MKKLVKVEEVEGEGTMGLLGEVVCIMGFNYIYTGKLVGVNDKEVMLEDAYIVYETGPWLDTKWKDAQFIAKSATVGRPFEAIFATSKTK